MEKVKQVLQEIGWREIYFARFQELEKSIEEPEKRTRFLCRTQIGICESRTPISAVVKSNIKTGQKRWGSAKRHG